MYTRQSKFTMAKKNYNITKIFHLLSLLFLLHLGFSCNIINEIVVGKEDDSQTEALTQLLLLRAIMNDRNCSGGFWVRSINTNKSYCSEATLVGSSESLDLYVENGLETGLDYDEVVNSFEEKINPIETKAFGEPTDINKDGKITVLVLDIQDDEILSSGFVAGFVDPINFYADSSAYSIRSNEREILYLDGNELIKLKEKEVNQGRPDTFLATLAHEYQHLIRFQYGEGYDDTWIDEGTSEAASDITGYGPQESRLECFRGDSDSSCSGGIGGYSLFSWNNSLRNYAFAYAFMRYLYDASGNTDDERMQFFQKTLTGDKNGYRANTSENLIQVFMSSASSYDSNLLGSDTNSVFQRLFASFIGQATGFDSLSTVYFGDTNAVDVDSLRTTYPLPSDFVPSIYTSPYSLSSKKSSYTLTPSQVYRVSGSTSGVSSGGSNTVIVKKDDNEFVIFNGNVSSSSSSTVSASFHNPLEIPKLHANHKGIVCPMEHLKQVNRIEKQLYNLKMVKR